MVATPVRAGSGRPYNSDYYLFDGNLVLLREDHFPLYLNLSPIGGEGKRWDRFDALPS